LWEESKKNITGAQICDEGFVWVHGISGALQDQVISFEKWVGFVRWES
jgi:hypothetical protein